MIGTIDSLEFSLDSSMYDRIFKESVEEWYDKWKDGENELEFLGIRFKIVGAPKFYALGIMCDDFTLYLARERKTEKTNVFPMRFELRQEFLWSRQDEAIGDVLRWIGQVMLWERSKVSRLDLACHFDSYQMKLKDVSKLHKRGGGKVSLDGLKVGKGNKFETIYVCKKAPLQLRIYNKSQEAKDKGKSWFKYLWRNFGLDEENVWNCEFQIRREVLKELGIDEIDDLDLKKIWAYCTKKWVLHGNTDSHGKVKLSRFWRQLQTIPFGDAIPKVRQVKKVVDVERLELQAIGCIAKAAELKGIQEIMTAMAEAATTAENKKKEQGIDIHAEFQKRAEWVRNLTSSLPRKDI